jgi:hypothetical protein
MEKAFLFEGQTIVDALTEAREKIAAIDNPEFTAKKNQLLKQLTGMINPIRVTQMDLEPEEYLIGDEALIAKSESEPLTKMFGIDLTKPTEKQDPFENERKDLIRQIESLEDQFSDLTDEKILDSFPDIVIRGLGKRLDFPFTEHQPKQLKLAHVKAIRQRLTTIDEIQSNTSNES